MSSAAATQQICRISATPVRVPRVAPLKSALGTSVTGSFGIVEIETEDGLSGLGEISMIWNGDGAALCPMVNEFLGPALIGTSAFAINRAHQIMDDVVQF